MLEPWIIEQIRRREEERRRGEQPRLDLPMPPMWPVPEESDASEDDDEGEKTPERGVVIIGS